MGRQAGACIGDGAGGGTGAGAEIRAWDGAEAGAGEGAAAGEGAGGEVGVGTVVGGYLALHEDEVTQDHGRGISPAVQLPHVAGL